MSIAGRAQLRQNERLLTSGEGDHNRRRHSGNHSRFGKVALAGIAESTLLCQSFVVWFRSIAALILTFWMYWHAVSIAIYDLGASTEFLIWL